MAKGLLSAAAVLLMLTTAGCGQSYDQRSATNYGSAKNRNAVDGPRAYGAQFPGDGPITHSISKLGFNQKLSDEVSALPGVNSAYVMTTDYNAYVAILLDNTATGTRGGNAKREVNNSGTDLGQYDPHTFTQGLDGNLVTRGYNSYDTVEDHNDLSHGLKQTVATTVRRFEPAIHDVYISANRDFVNQSNIYAQEAWKGHSLDPYVRDFEATINRLFNSFENGSNPNESRRP